MTYLICLVLALAAIFAFVSSEEVPNLQIKNKSFVISTRLVSYSSKDGTRVFETKEAYSSYQMRSKIEYKAHGTPDRQYESNIPNEGTIFVDNSNILLIEKSQRPICKKTYHGSITRFFHLHHLGWDQPDEQLYLAGPAKILFFLDNYRNQFVKEESDSGYNVRNIPTFYYKLTLRVDHQDIDFYIHYAEASKQDAIPIKVIVKLPNYRELSFNFVLNDLLSDKEAEFDQKIGLHAGGDDDIIFDQFAIDRGIGCANIGQILPLGRLFDARQTNSKSSFSFMTLIDKISRTGINSTWQAFVAYESSIDSMRVVLENPSWATSSVTNFYLGRTYHTIEHNEIDRQIINKIVDLDTADKNNEPLCVVAKAHGEDKEECPYSLGELIAGAEKFVFLGYAQVRGIRAQVFEAFNSSQPIWFDQPMIYNDRSTSVQDVEKLRSSYSSRGQIVFNTVVYVSEQGDSSTMKLLHMEIYRISLAENSKILSKTMLPVFGFSWKLDESREAPNGQLTQDLFSLADLCPSSSIEDNHYNKLSMRLVAEQRADSIDLEWLKIPTKRNFATLASLQKQFKLPTTMVYGLESKIQVANDQRLIMFISFQLASHSSKLAKLYFAGTASLKSRYRNRLTNLPSDTFRGCYYSAAHRKTDTFFAYDPKIEVCWLDADLSSTSRNEFGKINLEAFDIDVDGPLDLYFVIHEENTLNKWTVSDFTVGHNKIKVLSKLKLFNSDSTNNSQELEFSISSLEMDKENSQATEDDKTSNKFMGLGLVETEGQNKLAQPQRLYTDNWAPSQNWSQYNTETEMTFEQCQAICLSDFECQSFSICVQGSQIDCLLSNLSFRSADMVSQLNNIQNMPLKIGKLISLNATDLNQAVQIKKHPNCEIHNKIYLDFFDKQKKVGQSISNRIIHAASGREQCAKMCFDQIIEIVYVNAPEISAIKSDNLDEDVRTIKNLFNQHRNITMDICRAFFYVDKSELAELPQSTQSKILGQVIRGEEQQSINGYCMMGERLNKAEQMHLNESGKFDLNASVEYVEFRRYNFKFETMYNRQYGVRLKPSARTTEEYVAYMDIEKHGSAAAKASYAIMRSFVERNDNIQVKIDADTTKCALVCYTQSWGPWPACKSFHISIISSDDKSFMSCFLNSLSLQEALHLERFDLIEHNETRDGKIQVWHYDPKPGFVAAKVDTERQYEISWFKLGHLLGSGSRISSSVVFVTVILALVGGLIFGIMLGSTYLSSSGKNREDTIGDTKYLVEKQTVEFSHLRHLEEQFPG